MILSQKGNVNDNGLNFSTTSTATLFIAHFIHATWIVIMKSRYWMKIHILCSSSSIIRCIIHFIWFFTDILLHFRTTYVSRKGEVVSDWRSIALNYLRGWFVVDLLAALPFDHLYASDLYTGEVSWQRTFEHSAKERPILRFW